MSGYLRDRDADDTVQTVHQNEAWTLPANGRPTDKDYALGDNALVSRVSADRLT